MADMLAPPLHVLYVLYRYPQLSQTFVRDEIWALRGAGIRVDVLSLDDPGEDRPDDGWAGPHEQVARPSTLRAAADLAWWMRHRPSACVKFLKLAMSERSRCRYLLLRVPSAARRAQHLRADHLHTHFAWDTATVASAFAELLGVTSSITLHAKDVYAQRPSIVRRRLRAFSDVITVCHFNTGFMEGASMLDARARTVRVVPCGVASPPATASNPAVRGDVVAVGRLVEKKGFDVLLYALASLGDVAVDIRTVIVGDGPLRGELEALRDALGLRSRVTFTGALPHHETLAHIGAGQVFCLPAKPAPDGDSDAMPVVIREAMVRGVPVIASRLAGIPESVDPTVGWLIEPDSVTSLTEALRSALTDAPGRRRRGSRARGRAEERWTFEQQATSLVGVFSDRLA